MPALRFLGLVVLLLGVLASSAHAKSEFAVWSVSVEGHGGGAWSNPVGESCLRDGAQESLRGSMRETLTLRTPKPTLVTISGLNGNAGPMSVDPLDRSLTAPVVEATLTREGTVEYLACRAPARPVEGMDGCFGTRTYKTALGLALTGSQAQLIVSSPSGLESTVFSCEPEEIDFRPSSLLPGSSSLRAMAPIARKRLQRAKPGTVIVLKGTHQRGRDSTTGCKAGPPSTCEPYTGELTVRLTFVCRAKRTGQRCKPRG